MQLRSPFYGEIFAQNQPVFHCHEIFTSQPLD